MTPAQRARCEQRSDAPAGGGSASASADAIEAARPNARKGHITPAWLSYQVGQTLDPDTIIVNELVNTAHFNRTKPGTQFNAGGSSLGWAAPAAVGAKVAAPDRQIVVLHGRWLVDVRQPAGRHLGLEVPQGAGAVHHLEQPRLLDWHHPGPAQLSRGLRRQGPGRDRRLVRPVPELLRRSRRQRRVRRKGDRSRPRSVRRSSAACKRSAKARRRCSTCGCRSTSRVSCNVEASCVRSNR